MMKWVLLAAGVQLTIINMIDGRQVAINPANVTHMSEARRDVDTDKQLHPDVRCVIFFTDGSYLSAKDECIAIVNRWAEERRP